MPQATGPAACWACQHRQTRQPGRVGHLSATSRGCKRVHTVQGELPAIGKVACRHTVDLVGESRVLCAVRLDTDCPCRLEPLITLTDAGMEMLANTLRRKESGVLRPSIAALCEANLLLAKRIAVRGAGVVFVRSTVANMALDNDERGNVVDPPECLDSLRDPPSVIGVADSLHVPAMSEEARRNIITECD